ncbi:MAG: hypothetical protein WD004_07080 [Actinomycetota bacterium]
MGAASIIVFLALPAIVAGLLARRLVRLRIARLWVANVRGLRVPVILGFALWVGWASAVVGALGVLALERRWSPEATVLVLVAALWTAVAAVGFVDDLASGGPRGLRSHLASLVHGRPTTGILKVGVIVLAALAAAALVAGDGGPVRILAAAVAIAGCANVWNGLDVSPGRAGKWFLVVAIGVLIAGPRSVAWPLLLILTGAEAALVVFDVRERGMLGDLGSNLLGFAIGTQVAAALPTWPLVAAAVLVVVLNVVAETVTFSSIIGVVPPLRWFDRLGRRPPGPISSPN